MRQARLDSIFEFHIGDEFGNRFCPARRRHVFRGPPRALSCGGYIICSPAAICAKSCEHPLGLTMMAAEMRAGGRAGRNGRHPLAGITWQSVFGRLAGYEDVTGAERLRS